MTPTLTLTAIEKDGCVRVATTGDITVVEIHPLGKNPFEGLLGERWAESRVLLDFHNTRFIDSAAIGWLISTQRQFRVKGGTLVIHSIDARVRRMLEILRVEQVVTLLPDESAARDFVATKRAA